MTTRSRHAVAAIAAAFAAINSACATFVQFLNDKPGWIAATGPFTSVGFAEFATGTIIADQYSALGITFPEGDDVASQAVPTLFPSDGAGLIAGPSITMDFAAPIASIAVEFPGLLKAAFYSEGRLLYSSGPLNPPGAGSLAGFAGFFSTESFDRVVLTNWAGGTGNVYLDTVCFQPVPAPAVLSLMFAALATPHRTRRRR